jgi:hypothetical protein
VRKFSVGLAALSLLGMSVSAEAATILLDGDTPETGSALMTQPLVTSAGTITLVQNDNFEFFWASSDLDMKNAGAEGKAFDILSSALTPPRLEFDFDVVEITFLYGGNAGGILVEALDINGVVVDFFQQDDTDSDQPAGPATLSGNGIRALRWNDTVVASDPSEMIGGYAVLDNIVLTPGAATTVPEPGMLGLVALGLAGLGVAARRRRGLSG